MYLLMISVKVTVLHRIKNISPAAWVIRALKQRVGAEIKEKKKTFCWLEEQRSSMSFWYKRSVWSLHREVWPDPVSLQRTVKQTVFTRQQSSFSIKPGVLAPGRAPYCQELSQSTPSNRLFNECGRSSVLHHLAWHSISPGQVHVHERWPVTL